LGTDTAIVDVPGRWQIRLRAAGLLSAVTYYSSTRSQSSEITQILEVDSWYQLGLSLDLTARRLHFAFRQVGAADDWSVGEFKMIADTLGPEVRKSGQLHLMAGTVGKLVVYDRPLTTPELRDALVAVSPTPQQQPVDTLQTSIVPIDHDASVNLPRRSDVPMSSRWWHPRDGRDPHDTLRDLASFHATRLEWIYDAAPEHIRAVTDAGFAFCTTINASDDTKGRPYSGRNFDGGVAYFSWMASWLRDGVPIGACCVNNQRYRAHHRDIIEAAVRAGAVGIQFDDWGSNVSFANNNGECFCEFCVPKFAAAHGVDYHEYLKKKGVPDLRAYLEYRVRNAADPLQRAYVQFQAESVREYLSALKQHLASITATGAKRPSLSVNANFTTTSQQSRSTMAADIPDYFVGEGGDETLAGMFINARIAEALQRTSIFSPFPYKVDVTRAEIALQYALGQLCLVPYDVWMHTSDQPRYFGKPEDFADLFAFVRANAALLEDAETVATVGISVDRTKPEEKTFRPLVQSLAERNIPFVLAFPGARRRPRIVIGPDQAALTAEQSRAASIVEVEPSRVVALPRAGRGFTALHLINRNTDEFSRRAVLRGFGVRLLQPRFWGPTHRVELLAPGAAPQQLTAAPFGRGLRIAVPELKDWAVLRIPQP